MPVDHRTTQPFGLLHGGVSVALAETIGSLAGFLSIEEGQIALGLDINANHLRPVKKGFVTAKAMPIALSQIPMFGKLTFAMNKINFAAFLD